MKTENILPDLTTPRVMAIVNVTPDSFFAGSRTPDAEAIERRVREAADAGCDLFDVGGYSSRSGAAEVTPEEEWRRVEAGVAAVRRIAPTLPVSVDTFRAEVARRVLETTHAAPASAALIFWAFGRGQVQAAIKKFADLTVRIIREQQKRK